MDIEQLEIELLFEALLRCYGYDFRDYAFPTARRRVLNRMAMCNLKSIGELQHLILHDKREADSLVRSLSINVTEMFRDPPFFLALRQRILPKLAKWDHFKIWHAGCASGEEVYSMAILLKEKGLYQRCRLYGTDFNDNILEKAQRGIMPLDQMRLNVRNYQASGGEKDFADYYHARYDGALIDKSLKKNIVFAQHNLTIDPPFGEFQMVVCRNVLIYFNHQLKEKVFQLFTDSLGIKGFLCIGSHETMPLNLQKDKFEIIDRDLRIYRKVKD